METSVKSYFYVSYFYTRFWLVGVERRKADSKTSLRKQPQSRSNEVWCPCPTFKFRWRGDVPCEAIGFLIYHLSAKRFLFSFIFILDSYILDSQIQHYFWNSLVFFFKHNYMPHSLAINLTITHPAYGPIFFLHQGRWFRVQWGRDRLIVVLLRLALF